jgi:hypothetical protein
LGGKTNPSVDEAGTSAANYKKKRAYNSYQGEITPAVPNILLEILRTPIYTDILANVPVGAHRF